MKKLLLLLITAFTLQPTLFGMKRLPEQIIEQENEKKQKTSILQPGVMTYTLKDVDIHKLTPQAAALYIENGDTLKLNPAAVQLCAALTDISDISQLVGYEVGKISFNFDQFDLSDYDVIALFDILNTISESARNITINNKIFYLNGDACKITIQKIKQHNLYALDGLIKIINVCDFLICPVVLNACAKILIEEPSSWTGQELNVFNQFSNNSGFIPFLKTHLKRINLENKLDIDIGEFSIADYVILNGLPTIKNVCHTFRNLQLTSLDGLNELVQLFKQQFSQVTTINFSDNFLDLADLTQLQIFFAHLPQLQLLALTNNQLTQLPDNIFNHLVQLKSLFLQNNQLIQLPATIFNHCIQLQSLLLDHNALIQLPGNIFDHLTQLNGLSLKRNQLTQLPKNIFDHLIQLNVLQLSHNKLIYFKPESLELMPQLLILDLKDNNLSETNVQELLNKGAQLDINRNPDDQLTILTN